MQQRALFAKNRKVPVPGSSRDIDWSISQLSLALQRENNGVSQGSPTTNACPLLFIRCRSAGVLRAAPPCQQRAGKHAPEDWSGNPGKDPQGTCSWAASLGPFWAQLRRKNRQPECFRKQKKFKTLFRRHLCLGKAESCQNSEFLRAEKWCPLH